MWKNSDKPEEDADLKHETVTEICQNVFIP